MPFLVLRKFREFITHRSQIEFTRRRRKVQTEIIRVFRRFPSDRHFFISRLIGKNIDKRVIVDVYHQFIGTRHEIQTERNFIGTTDLNRSFRSKQLHGRIGFFTKMNGVVFKACVIRKFRIIRKSNLAAFDSGALIAEIERGGILGPCFFPLRSRSEIFPCLAVSRLRS